MVCILLDTVAGFGLLPQDLVYLYLLSPFLSPQFLFAEGAVVRSLLDC